MEYKIVLVCTFLDYLILVTTVYNLELRKVGKLTNGRILKYPCAILSSRKRRRFLHSTITASQSEKFLMVLIR